MRAVKVKTVNVDMEYTPEADGVPSRQQLRNRLMEITAALNLLAARGCRVLRIFQDGEDLFYVDEGKMYHTTYSSAADAVTAWYWRVLHG